VHCNLFQGCRVLVDVRVLVGFLLVDMTQVGDVEE
jgi:hypothetical protein